MQTGHRLVVTAWGETPQDALDHHVRLEEMTAPALSGPRDVRIAVRCAAVGWVDLLMMSGQYQHMRPPPYVPGLEYSGVVDAVGPQVTRVRVGQRVLVDPFQAGPRSLGDYQAYGGFASWAIAPQHAVHPVPGDLDLAHAACLLGGNETAYHGLVARGRVQPAEVVLVLGACGAIGLAAVALARKLGAVVIAVGRSPEKLAVAAACGADHTVTLAASASGEGLREAVKSYTGGRGVDVIWDGVGGPLTAQALRCARFGARVLIMGWSATPNVARGKGGRGAPRANQLPTNLIMMKGLDVLGCPAAIAVSQDPGLRAERWQAIWRWAEAGELRPHISRRVPMAAWRDALEAKWAAREAGNIVLDV